MTVRELFREFVVAKQRREDEHDRDVALAWRVEAMHRQDPKQLPPLKRFLLRRAEPQTREAQQSVLQTLSARFGIPLRRTRLIQRPS